MKSWFLGLRPTVRDLVVLIALGAGLWLTSSGMWDLRGPDEGRYVQIAKELLNRTNWLYLTVHGVPYDQKPPLAFWLFALMLKINGGEVSSWLTRLPSVIAAIATVIMTYFMGRHTFGRRAGLFAALMLMTAPVFFDNATTAELNMLYTAAITGSLCAWLTRQSGVKFVGTARLVAFWGSLAAAFFIKGPLAFVIVLSVIGWETWQRRNWAEFRAFRPLAGTVILGVLIGGWLYLQRKFNGVDFVKEQIAGETLTRILTGDHGQPFWYYFPRIISTVLFPWALLTIPAGMFYLKSPSAHKMDSSVTPYLPWIGFPFLLLCIAHGKRQTYLLPLTPAATILLAAFFDRNLADKLTSRWVIRIAGALIAASGILIAILGAGLFFYPEITQSDTMWLSPIGFIILISCGFILVLIARRLLAGSAYYTSLFYACVAVILTLAWGNFMIIQPAFDPSKSTRYLANTLDLELKNRSGGHIADDAVIGAIGNASEAEYHVYGHYAVQSFRSAEVSLVKSGTKAPNWILVETNNKQYKRISQSLIDSGYTDRRFILVSKESLALYKKPIQTDDLASSATKTFFFVGDTGSGKPQIYHIVREMVKRHTINSAQGIFLLGDNLYHGPIVSRSLKFLFEEPFAPLLSKCIPVYATLGNHDYEDNRLRGEVEYPHFNMAGQRYYTMDFGVGRDSISVFVTDSESLYSGDPEQLSWLESSLNASKAHWKILLLHRPIEATKINHGSDKILRQVLQPMLKDLDVVFSGHNHLYERRKPVDGVLHITTGSGGQLSSETLTADNNRAIGYTNLGSFVEMQVKDGSMALTAWNEHGEKIDHVILPNHATELSGPR